jgi:8-oxo-dGTP pyrophosphatase MutT (NUDIX family)
MATPVAAPCPHPLQATTAAVVVPGDPPTLEILHMKAPAVRFVSIIAVDPFRDEVLLVKKIKGPKHLHGKFTFPGGKIEADDPSAAHAASRELLEEAGIEVPPFDLIHLTKRGNQEFSLEIFVAITSLDKAEPQPGEKEPVFKASLAQTRLKASQKDPDYLDDTSALLESLYTVRQIHRRLASASLRSSVPVRRSGPSK